MRIDYLLRGENFAIESVVDGSLGMTFINFMRLNTAAQWEHTGVGKQYSKSIENTQGGIEGYIDWLLADINVYLLDYFGDSVPTTDIEVMMAAIKASVVADDNQLVRQ